MPILVDKKFQVILDFTFAIDGTTHEVCDFYGAREILELVSLINIFSVVH